MFTLCRYVSGLDLEDAIRALLKSQYEPDFDDRWWEAGKILLKCLLQVCLPNKNRFIIATMDVSRIWAALYHPSLVQNWQTLVQQPFCQLLLETRAISLLR